MKKIVKDPKLEKLYKKMGKMSAEELSCLITEVLYIKAKFLFEAKNYEEVIRVANEALKKDPEALGVLAIKFRASKKLKKVQLAKRILIVMTKIDRDRTSIDPRFDWPTTRTSFYEEALPFLEPIIRKNLKDSVPIETKGRIFGLLKRYDDTIALIEWAYTIEPRNHTSPIFKEYILYRLGRRDNPIPDINNIIKETKTKNKKVLAYRDERVKEILEMEKNGRVYFE